VVQQDGIYLLLVANMNKIEVIMSWSAVGLGKITNATEQVQHIFSDTEL